MIRPALAPSKKKIFGFLLVALFASVFAPGQPRLHYVNELNDHTHDLALKLSLSMAAQKADTEFAIVQIRALPDNKDMKSYANELFQELRIGKSHRGRGVRLSR